MNHLKDLPPGTIWPHLFDAIERDVIADIRSYAESRRNDVNRGAETPELAAVMVDKYAGGLSKALHIAGIDSRVRAVKANQNPLKYAGKHNYTLPPAIIFCG